MHLHYRHTHIYVCILYTHTHMCIYCECVLMYIDSVCRVYLNKCMVYSMCRERKRHMHTCTLLITVAPCWCPPAASCACGWPCLSSIPPARRWSPSPLRTTCCSRSSPRASPPRAACVCWPLSACVSHAAKLGTVTGCQQPQAVKVTKKAHQRPTGNLFFFYTCIYKIQNGDIL